MRLGRTVGIGVLALAVGCATKPFSKRAYVCGEQRVGTDYIATTPSGHTRYIDGNCSEPEDNNLDEKQVYVNRPEKFNLLLFEVPFNAPVLVEHTVLTDSRERVRWGPRREYDPDIGQVVDRAEAYVLRTSEDGRRLQDEFKGVKAKVPQD